MNDNSEALSQIDNAIDEQEDKIQNLQDSLEATQLQANNPKPLISLAQIKERITDLENQISQAEEELIRLLAQKQQVESLESIKDLGDLENNALNSGQPEFDWESESETAKDFLREAIRVRLAARRQRKLDLLAEKTAAAHQLLGADSELFQTILKATEAPANSDERGEAILKLSQLVRPETQAALLQALLNFFEVEHTNINFWASEALVVVGRRNVDLLLPRLQELLHSSNWVLRAQAVAGLERLVQRPRFPNPRTAFELNGYIVTNAPIDDRVLEALLPMLHDPNSKVRRQAVAALCHTGDSRATAQLVQALNDPAREVRLAAAAFLNNPVGAEEAIPALLAAYERYHDDKEIRDRITQSLDMLGYSGDAIPVADQFGTKILQALGGLNLPQATQFAENFKEKHEAGDEAAVADMMQQLFRNKLAPQGVAPLIAKLQDPDEAERAKAAQQLGFLKDAQAVEPLIATLADPALAVRKAALSSLAMLKPRSAVASLLALVENDQEILQVRGLAIYALGCIKDRTVVPTLLNILAQLSPTQELELMQEGLKLSLLSALGELADPESYTAVMPFVNSPVLRVSRAAIIALGGIARNATESTREGTLEFLLKILQNDSDEQKRIAAAYSLGALGDNRAISALREAAEKDPYHDNEGYDDCVHSAARDAIEQIENGPDED